MYDMTTWNPIAMGTCSGEGVGCTTLYGFDWLSDGRMVILTNDYLGHDQKPASRSTAKVSIVSTPIGSGSTVTTIASNFKQPQCVSRTTGTGHRDNEIGHAGGSEEGDKE